MSNTCSCPTHEVTFSFLNFSNYDRHIIVINNVSRVRVNSSVTCKCFIDHYYSCKFRLHKFDMLILCSTKLSANVLVVERLLLTNVIEQILVR